MRRFSKMSALVLSVVMVLGTCTVSFAATSPDTKTEAAPTAKKMTTEEKIEAANEAYMLAVKARGGYVAADGTVYTPTVVQAADVASTSGVSASAAGVSLSVSAADAGFVSDATQVALGWFGQSFGNVKVQRAFEINGALTGPTNITIAVPGVTAGQRVGIIHKTGSGKWESIPVVSVGSGSVTGTFTSLSPVAIVVGGDAPKTGE